MLIINYVLIIPSYLRGIWRYNLKVFCKYLGFKNVMLLALRVSSVSKKYFRSFINIQILTHFLQIIFWDTLLGKKKVRLFEYDILVTLSIWNSFVSIAIFQRSIPLSPRHLKHQFRGESGPSRQKLNLMRIIRIYVHVTHHTAYSLVYWHRWVGLKSPCITNGKHNFVHSLTNVHSRCKNLRHCFLNLCWHHTFAYCTFYTRLKSLCTLSLSTNTRRHEGQRNNDTIWETQGWARNLHGSGLRLKFRK